MTTDPVHTESETHGWDINVPDHPTRTDSPEYVAARQKMNEIAAGATGLVYGSAPTPGSQLAQQKQAAESANQPLILGPDHPLAQQAFVNQQ